MVCSSGAIIGVVVIVGFNAVFFAASLLQFPPGFAFLFLVFSSLIFGFSFDKTEADNGDGDSSTSRTAIKMSRVALSFRNIQPVIKIKTNFSRRFR